MVGKHIISLARIPSDMCAEKCDSKGNTYHYVDTGSQLVVNFNYMYQYTHY